jgi:hypothetical protein
MDLYIITGRLPGFSSADVAVTDGAALGDGLSKRLAK